MRKSLFSAAAVAPLAMMAAAPALAATTISGSTSTPVQTATANNGQPDDVSITGQITIPSTATAPVVAATLNSNNQLTNSGSISIKDVTAPSGPSATGAQIDGGFNGAFTNSGSVIVNESYTPADSNNVAATATHIPRCHPERDLASGRSFSRAHTRRSPPQRFEFIDVFVHQQVRRAIQPKLPR